MENIANALFSSNPEYLLYYLFTPAGFFLAILFILALGVILWSIVGVLKLIGFIYKLLFPTVDEGFMKGYKVEQQEKEMDSANFISIKDVEKKQVNDGDNNESISRGDGSVSTILWIIVIIICLYFQFK